MDHARELARYWSWLPAFRAVAETQHLPTAAKVLCLSPSAVSRTIKLLEEELGEPLFDRTQGRLVLNHRGEVLLACVRASMRLVHEAGLVMREAQLRGPIRMSAPVGLASLFLLPALPKLVERHPHLAPEVETQSVAELSARLLRGDCDVALAENPAPHEGLRTIPLARLEHDAFVRKDARADDIDELGFVVPISRDARVYPDAWPESRPRRIALRVSCATMAIDAVKSGLDAVVLPVCLGLRAGLRRLHAPGLRSTDLVLLVRSELPGLATTADIVAESIRAYVATHADEMDGVSPIAWAPPRRDLEVA